MRLLKTRVLYYRQPPLTGEDVKELQSRLIEKGFQLSIDGIFGTKTKQVVEEFQAKVGLSIDGVVGPKTRKILNARFLYLTTPYIKGPDVEAVQREIAALNIPITVDGVFGPGTKRAIQTFQQHQGLLADGVVGPKTLTQLLS